MEVFHFELPLDDVDLLSTLTFSFVKDGQCYHFDEKTNEIVLTYFPNKKIEYSSQTVAVDKIPVEKFIGKYDNDYNCKYNYDSVLTNTIIYLFNNIPDMDYLFAGNFELKKNTNNNSIFIKYFN
jgi:hypothetical protein